MLLSGALWLAVTLVPGLELTRGPVQITASDNREALIRLSTDPLTIRRTRVDALGGLVNLMDAALAAAPRMRVPALFLYGGKDELVPKAATAATWRALPRGGADGAADRLLSGRLSSAAARPRPGGADRRHRGLAARPVCAAALGGGAGGGSMAGGAGLRRWRCGAFCAMG